MRKGIVGLADNDVGRLLNAHFASSWGLSRIMQVQRGVLLASSNDFYAAVAEAVGELGMGGLAADLGSASPMPMAVRLRYVNKWWPAYACIS